MRRIALLGAGISGLAAGWFIKNKFGKDVELTILEKESRPGGWIQTVQHEGFLFEQGPRSCRTKGAGQTTLALIEELGLENEVITPHPDAKSRFLYDSKGLQALPKGLAEVPFNPLTKGWMKALWRDMTMPRRQSEDESIHAFFSRRIGNEWAERLIDPFVTGIYAGDCRRLSMKSAFQKLDEWEQHHGSLIKGMWNSRHSSKEVTSPFVQRMSHHPMFSFKEGMEALPRALAQALKESLHVGQKLEALSFNQNGVSIFCSEGKQFQADLVLSTLPLYELAPLLTGELSIAEKLLQVRYASVVSVNVGYRHQVNPRRGFGYLVPSSNGLPILGAVWDSAVFPQHNEGEQERITVMMGGTHHPEVEQMSDEGVIALAQRALHAHMGIRSDPAVMQIKRASHAIPQFELGYAAWREELQSALQRACPGLILGGSGWSGVAINDCIAKVQCLF